MDPNEGQPIYWNIDGVQIEIKYPGKLYWPDNHITKLELVTYYKEIADIMMPYLEKRPVTLHYFPRGIHQISFYKRDYSKPVPGLIDTYPYKEISQDKTIRVPIIASKTGIIYLASKGCIEFHTWASTVPDVMHPTWAVIDLDVAVSNKFDLILDAASLINEFLSSIKIQSFPKTSGGSGMHIYIPIKRIYEFDFVRNWVMQLGLKMQSLHPDIFTVPQKQNRTHNTDKVVIDYMQNVITRNTASVYTVRAKKNAPVSTPVTWDEIAKKTFKPIDFNLKTVPKRIREKGDLFAPVLNLEQELQNFLLFRFRNFS